MYVSKKKALLFLLLLLGLFLPLGREARAEGAQISGVVWLEKTVDGAYNNESGLAGATVALAQRQENGEEKNVQVINFSYDPYSNNGDSKMSYASALTGEIQMKKNFLFITDSYRFEELNENDSFINLFNGYLKINAILS